MLQIIIIVLSVVADQLLKHFLIPVLQAQPGQTIPVIENFFSLTYVENRGASFGILQDARIFFIIITTVVLLAAAFFMVRTRKNQSAFLKISLSLVVGGAIGNYIDRIFIGFVRDVFDFSGFGFPWVFNIADACLVVGSILLGIYILFIYKEKDGKGIFSLQRKRKNASAESADEENKNADDAKEGSNGAEAEEEPSAK